MPRDAVSVSALSQNALNTNPAGTSITPANGANIAAAGDTSRLLVRVTNTAGATKDVTFKAGSNPPGLRAGIGDLTVTVPATTGDVLVVLESARFLQADGSINVDFVSAHAGVISAVRLPKGA